MGNFPMKDLLHMKRNIESIVVFRSVHWFFSLLLSAVFPMKAPPSGKKNLIEQKKKNTEMRKRKREHSVMNALFNRMNSIRARFTLRLRL